MNAAVLFATNVRAWVTCGECIDAAAHLADKMRSWSPAPPERGEDD